MDENEFSGLSSLKDMIDYAANEFGETDFLCWKKDGVIASKTYKELKASCDAFSRMLIEKGFKEPHVAVIGPTSFQWIVSYFGTADCGGTVVPLATSETDEMNEKLIDFSDVDVFVFDKKHESLYEILKENSKKIRLYISVDNSSEFDNVLNIDELLGEYAGEYSEVPDGNKMCAIVFTSGTTGFPKGVMLSHKNLVYSATSVHVACPTKRMFCCLPIYHCFCFTANITKSIVRGKTVCVNDSLSNIVPDLQLYKPDSIIAVPQLVKKLMYGAIKFAKSKPQIPEEKAVKAFFGGNIIDIISGGAPLSTEDNARFNQTGIYVFNGYGMTECAPIIANNALGNFRHGSVGKPIPCMNVKIEDGEILVKGPSVMLGYYKNPNATKEAFTADGWLHTGDVGHFDDDGFLYVTGRCKNLILLDNGENVSAEMLEEKFTNEPFVKEVICHGDNGSICAEVFPDKEYASASGITDQDKEMVSVLLRVNSGLAAFQRISSYSIRDIPFPRTSSSKIKRDDSYTSKHTIVNPSTLAEKLVCNTVKDLLMLKEISVTDNFFAIGGNSLNAMELAVTLNIPVQLIYDKPFLGVLAKEMDRRQDSADDDIPDINDVITETKSEEIINNFHCALLTGATGFLGVHILKELVDRKIKVYCLVRDTTRLEKQIKYYFDNLDMSFVFPVLGNIEKENLGLEPERYNSLADEVDVVFHTAANVHHAGDYSDLERTNVTGTKNVIAFAKSADAVLEHTSTVSIHGAATVIEKHTKASFDETVLDIGQHYWDNVYIHSKYCAEEAVLMARKGGLRANIYRIGNLTWRSADGKFQKNSEDNGFLRRIHAMLKLGIYNTNMDKYPIDMTPVDECAKAYVNLAFSGNVNEIYHMYNPNFIDTREMYKILNVPFRTVSTAETIESVMANMNDRDIHVFMFYLIISGRSSGVEMLNEKTIAALRKTGFEWSVPGKKYLTISDNGTSGHFLDFEKITLNPMRKTGGIMTPIQKLSLGVLQNAEISESEVIRGHGAISRLPEAICSQNVKRPLVVTFKGAIANNSIASVIKKIGKDIPVFESIAGEPTIGDAEKVLEIFENENCDSVVAIGGGSVLDIGKVTALLSANKGAIIDDICRLSYESNKCVPLFAVPTTSGTGSENTMFAVITDDENEKHPFISDKFQPDVIILDPCLTLTVPKLSTAYTGVDALSHAVEAYIGQFADFFPEDRDIAPSACKKILRSLRTACDESDNIDARENMQIASYEAGIAFRRIGTGYVHAVAHRLGEFYHVPHGQAIAAAFTPILRAYLPWNEKKLGELSVKCGVGNTEFSDSENAEKFINEIDNLLLDTGANANKIPFDECDLPEIVRRAQDEAKQTGYPRPFSDDELSEIIKEMF